MAYVAEDKVYEGDKAVVSTDGHVRGWVHTDEDNWFGWFLQNAKTGQPVEIKLRDGDATNPTD